AGEALHLVELPLARLAGRRQGPPARSRVGRARARRPGLGDAGAAAIARLAAAVRPRAGDRDAGAVTVRDRGPRGATPARRLRGTSAPPRTAPGGSSPA